MPGISAVPLPGHTPGHTGWLGQSGNEILQRKHSFAAHVEAMERELVRVARTG